MNNEEKLKYLSKELINREMDLLDFDNFVQSFLKSNSLYDGNMSNFNPYDGCYCYFCGYNPKTREDQDICIYFDFLEPFNDKYKTRIKITDVSLL